MDAKYQGVLFKAGKRNAFTLKQSLYFKSSATKKSVFNPWVSWLQFHFVSLTPIIPSQEVTVPHWSKGSDSIFFLGLT